VSLFDSEVRKKQAARDTPIFPPLQSAKLMNTGIRLGNDLKRSKSVEAPK